MCIEVSCLSKPVFPNVGASRLFYVESGALGVFISGWEMGYLYIFFFKFSKISQYWLQKESSERNWKLWEATKLFFIAIPTSYVAECGFNTVTQIIKQRNCLQITKWDDLWLLLSSMEPRVRTLSSKHKSQPLHWKHWDKQPNEPRVRTLATKH